MKKLDKLGLIVPNAKDAERLDRWLFEWNLLKDEDAAHLEGGDSKDESRTAEAEDSRDSDIQQIEDIIAPPDCEIAAGQIRLMASTHCSEPVYIAVAAVAPDGMVVCVPFGVLSEPAADDELLCGRECAVTRVWCLWNRRRLPAEAVAKSWIADSLNAEEMKRLMRALAVIDAGDQLPPDLQRDSGPPLIHPLDPRREYIYRERRRIDQVFSCAAESRDNIISYDIFRESQQFLKAAEPKGDDYKA